MIDLYLSSKEIQVLVEKIGRNVDQHLSENNIKEPIFLGVMNGSFMFYSDLMKRLTHPSIENAFVEVHGTDHVQTSWGSWYDVRFWGDIALNNRDVVIVEDMLDSGRSILELIEHIDYYDTAKSITIVSLLVRNEQSLYFFDQYKTIYGQMMNQNGFIWGYGLDLDGKQRNLDSIFIES